MVRQLKQRTQARAAVLLLGALSLTLSWLPSGHAFDYLEHSYLSDRACLLAQRSLGQRITQSASPRRLLPRLLALGLLCPLAHRRPYCGDDTKLAQSALSQLAAPPEEEGVGSLTLGDVAALPDHLSAFGPLLDLDGAQSDGLVGELIRLLAPTVDAPNALIRDVAENACETDGLVPWARVEEDIADGYGELARALPRRAFAPGAWRSPARGPTDPAGIYSFDNPHYLDLVLNNHNHFGDEAFGSWSGYHAAALALAARPCAALLKLEEGQLEALAEGSPRFEALEWDELPPRERQQEACSLTALRVGERVERWLRLGAPELTAPVRALLERPIQEEQALLQDTLSALIGLTYEGVGLHYLQDNLAGGHLRVDRAAHGLGTARHLHDTDGRRGVIAELRTPSGHQRQVLFGDSYLLGDAGQLPGDCSAEPPIDRVQLGACHLRRQRARVVAQSAASIAHWALEGPAPDESACAASAQPLLCQLPLQPTRALRAGAEGIGTLPLAPPHFAFQSLATSLSLDARGEASQAGLRLLFLSALGDEAGWMTSYHFGFLQTARHSAGGAVGDEALTEFAFMFHWRWAARFLVNGGVYSYLGFQGLGDEPALFGGLGPNIGVTLLPEGWTKIPLEISVGYRVPVTLFNSHQPFEAAAIGVEAHWLELALGLAFM